MEIAFEELVNIAHYLGCILYMESDRPVKKGRVGDRERRGWHRQQ